MLPTQKELKAAHRTLHRLYMMCEDLHVPYDHWIPKALDDCGAFVKSIIEHGKVEIAKEPHDDERFRAETDRDNFLVELDGMIESTEEFIKDDGLNADESRIHDLSALWHVRDLWLTIYKPRDEVPPQS